MARIYTDEDLRAFCPGIEGFQSRHKLADLEKYLSVHPQGMGCVLFGLRRTGKTVMMLQAAMKAPEKSVFIMVDENDLLGDIENDLWRLKKRGYSRFFLDEVSKTPDFTQSVDQMTDSLAMMGCHLVFAGTDSLSFSLAQIKALGRLAFINTTRIPFAENKALFPDLSISGYAKYGGILARKPFFSRDSDLGKIRREHTLSAIAENIQHSLANFQGTWPGRLKILCQRGEMTSLINLCAHFDTHRLLIEAVNRKYASGDAGQLVHAMNEAIARGFAPDIEIDAKKLRERHRKSIPVLNIEERLTKLDQSLLDEVEDALREIGALTRVKRLVSDKDGNITGIWENVFNQPAVRWGQVETLIDAAKSMYPEIPEELYKDVGKAALGRTFEDAVMLETKERCEGKGCEVLRFSHVEKDNCAEADIVVALPKKAGFCAYEVKTREKSERKDFRHLRNKDFIRKIEKLYGPMLDYGVIRPDADESVPHEIDAEKFVLEKLPGLPEKMNDMAKAKSAKYLKM